MWVIQRKLPGLHLAPYLEKVGSTLAPRRCGSIRLKTGRRRKKPLSIITIYPFVATVSENKVYQNTVSGFTFFFFF